MHRLGGEELVAEVDRHAVVPVLGRDAIEPVALVVGGGGAIGSALAEGLARADAKVAVSGRTQKSLDDAVGRIAKAGSEGLAIAGDATEEAAADQIVKQVVDRFGRLDIVFANAGINGVWAPIVEFTLDEWNTTINTNLTSTFLTVRAAIPFLKRR